MFSVKEGVPSEQDFEWLSHHLEKWKIFGRRLEIEEGTLMAIDNYYRNNFDKIYNMLRLWRKMNDSAATYTVLHDALCHPLVDRKDLATKLEVINWSKFEYAGNISLILQFNNNTITYKYSAKLLRHHAFWPLVFFVRC